MHDILRDEVGVLEEEQDAEVRAQAHDHERLANPRILGVLDPDAEVVIEDDRPEQKPEQVAIRPRHRRRPRLIEQARRDEQDHDASERPVGVDLRRADADAEDREHQQLSVRDELRGDVVEHATVPRDRDGRADHGEHHDEPARDHALSALRCDPAAAAHPERDRAAEHRQPDRPVPRERHDRPAVAGIRGEPQQHATERIPQRRRILRDEQEHEVPEQDHHRDPRPSPARTAQARQRVQEEHRDQKQRVVGIREQHYGGTGPGSSAPVGATGGNCASGLLGGNFAATRHRA